MRALILFLLTGISYGQIVVQGGVSMQGGISFGTKSIITFHTPTNNTADQTSAPASLIGLTGIGQTAVDTTGATIVRATDYSINGGSAGTASFRTNSDSNDQVWSSDDKAFGVVRTNGALELIAFDPVAHTVSPKGISGTSNLNGTGDFVAWSHSSPMTYYGTTGSVLNRYTINTASSTWTSATGTQDLSAAISTTALLDISSGCPGYTDTPYAGIINIYSTDSADRFISFATRIVQDQGTQGLVYDSLRGCRWFDLRTMTQGGAFGPSGSITNSATMLLPIPPAPTATATTGGSLTQAHTYTVCITYVKVGLGETPCSSNTSVTVNSPNNAISVTAPTANPSNTAAIATGFNIYACDNTVSPGCTPIEQTNGTNASGALAQPTGLSLACTSNCSGSLSYSIWLVANNAGGQSPYSAAATASSLATKAVFTLTFSQVTNASTYTVYVNNQFIQQGTSRSASCAAGTCTLTVDTNANNGPFSMTWNQLVPIATTPVITSLSTTTQIASTTNATGTKVHDTKFDGTAWQMYSLADANNTLQSAYTTNPVLFIDEETGVAVLTSLTSTPALNAASAQVGHKVVGFGKYVGFDGPTGQLVQYTLNDNSHTMETSKICLGNCFTVTTDAHFSMQMQAANTLNPLYIGEDGATYLSHAVPTTYPTNYMLAVENVPTSPRIWKLCQNWESGLQGFNSQVSGHPSLDGKFVAFSSDMGIGTGVTSGQLGSTSGGSTCTDGNNCRTDVFVCIMP